MIQMLMSVLWITEAAVQTPIAPTHLGTTTVPVLEDISATDLTAQVTLPERNFYLTACYVVRPPFQRAAIPKVRVGSRLGLGLGLG